MQEKNVIKLEYAIKA